MEVPDTVAPVDGDLDDTSTIPGATAVLGSWLYVGADDSVRHQQRSLFRGVIAVVSITSKCPPPWLVGKAGLAIATATAAAAAAAESTVVAAAAAADSEEGSEVAGLHGGPLPFEHLHVEVEDTSTADISQHFDVICDFLARAKDAAAAGGGGSGGGGGGGGGGRVIVHCASGNSRSVAAVAAYLMSREDHSLGEALERIRSRRPTAAPSPACLRQLVQYELTHRGGVPSDLRAFRSLPSQWQFISWQDPLRANQTYVSCHGRLMRVKQVGAVQVGPRLTLLGFNA